MRNPRIAAVFLFASGAGFAGIAMAQGMPPGMPPGLANIKIVQAEPERPGDRALSCEQITAEIGQIMQKRNVTQAAQSSKGKICSSKQVLDRQSDEKLKLSQTQNPALVAASLTPGPGANAVVARVNAENMALEQRQQPARQQAMGQMMAGVGDMVAAFNDPRLMRLGLLMQQRQCAVSSAPPPPQVEAPADPCEGTEEPRTLPAPAPAGAPDPFARR